MRASWALGLVALGGACILEDNPSFMPQESVGTDTSAGTDTTAGTGGPGPGTADVDGTATDGTDGSADTGTTGPDVPDVGCNDPTRCTVMHVGVADDMCPHEEEGVQVTTCDFAGTWGLRIAAGTAEAIGGEALILLYPDGDMPGRHLGGVEIPGSTTVTAAPGVPLELVEIYFGGEPGLLRLIGDEVYVHDVTLVVTIGAEHAVTTRLDPAKEGSETGGHVLENLVIAVPQAEDVGANSITSVFQSIGPDTTIANNHIWGYFESEWDVRYATGTVIAHNTIVGYQDLGDGPLFDAQLVDDLEISNNVIASLTADEPFVVAVDATTLGVRVAGNHVEGYAAVLGPGAPAAPGLEEIDSVVGPIPAEAPHVPRILADATITASPRGASPGRSLDGVDLAGASERLPGAYQIRSDRSGPRATVVRVGDGSCGADPCDLQRSDAQEIQHGVWRTWPGGTLEIHPSDQPYAGPAVVTWPMTVTGAGEPEQSIVARTIEDPFLAAAPPWAGEPAVLRVNRSIGTPTLVQNLTLEVASGERALTHEGRGTATLTGRHEVRRLVLRDDGTTAGAPALHGLSLGTDVVAHDILVHGDFSACVRFGPRTGEGSSTPTTTAYVHHLTCRLTAPLSGGSGAVFEVANVDGVVIADIAAELADAGAIFRAQRRTSGDTGTWAIDTPDSFVAHSLVVRGHATVYDDFDPLAGSFTVTALAEPLVADPFFVSALDSHLAPLAVGIDDGVDPSTLDGQLSLGVSVDGVDRAGQTVDRGAYEQ